VHQNCGRASFTAKVYDLAAIDMHIAFVPKENRDPSNPIKYIVAASDELVQKITELQNQRGPI
jgi:hypothetical protein